MDEILEATRRINQLLKESKEYKRFVFARSALSSNSEMYQRVKELKQHYRDVQTYWEGNPYDEIYRMCQEQDELLHNSVVNEYLRAESAFSRLIRRVVDEAAAGFDMELD